MKRLILTAASVLALTAGAALAQTSSSGTMGSGSVGSGSSNSYPSPASPDTGSSMGSARSGSSMAPSNSSRGGDCTLAGGVKDSNGAMAGTGGSGDVPQCPPSHLGKTPGSTTPEESGPSGTSGTTGR